MKGLKRLSLYHVLKARHENRFLGDTAIDFLSHICKSRKLDAPLIMITTVIAVCLVLWLGKGFFWFLIIDSLLFASITFCIAAIDTYSTYKYRLRQKMISIIRTLFNVEK